MSRHRFQKDEVRFFPALPSGWREERIHDVADLRTSNVDKKSEECEKPVRLCNYVDVYKNDKVTMALDFMEATATDAQLERFGLRAGDVVITKDSETPDDIGVPALIAETAPDLVCGYHLTILRPNEDEVSGGYLFYAVASRLSAYQFYLAANGVTRFGLTYQGTKNVRIALPSIPEQQQIAAFLDWKTGQIDALIARKRELLEKLKEQRLAVITQAVTQGINPAAPLRDSGILWLGQVPAHWEVKRIKFIGRIGNGSTPSRENPLYWTDGDFPWLNSSVVNQEAVTMAEQFVTAEALAECHLPIVQPPAVLIGITGEGKTRGMATTLLFEATINQHLAYVKPEPSQAIVGFLRRVFDMAYPYLRSESDGGGSTKGAITCEQIAEMSIPVPPIAEQETIADHIDAEAQRIDRMMGKVETVIDRLAEYRTALITAATTGKIDVRNETFQ